MAEESTAVLNGDVRGLVRRLDRFTVELAKAQSSGGSILLDADNERVRSYLQSLEDYHSWVTSQPQQDLPESHPTPKPVPPAPGVPDIENDDLIDLLQMLWNLRVEMVNGQSARLPSGLYKPDSTRFTKIIAKARGFINDYVMKTQPLDTPESSPRSPQSGPGRQGT